MSCGCDRAFCQSKMIRFCAAVNCHHALSVMGTFSHSVGRPLEDRMALVSSEGCPFPSHPSLFSMQVNI